MMPRKIENWNCCDYGFFSGVPDPPVILDLLFSFQDTPEIRGAVRKMESIPIEFGSRKEAVEKLREIAERIEEEGETKVGGTPKEDFYEPILSVLREMGGRGRAREVANRVGKMMGAELENKVDQEPLSDGLPRWMNRCYWARHDLKLQGKLKKDSPRGIWELS